MSATVGAGRLKVFMLVLLHLVAIGFAALESRAPRTSAGETRSGT
jgi:hypothetical protein